MAYKILSFAAIYDGETLSYLAVRVEMSPGDIRILQARNKPTGGYMWLLPSDKINDELIQKVAAYGMQVSIFHSL